jgi:UDP-2,4-diacetamido-2,4,6-trideoxy-beta-L-altropyranose hydrolase
MTRACSVVFRVDESVRMGWGHMSRCRALAEALTKAGAEVSFWCRDIRAGSRLTLQRFGIRVSPTNLLRSSDYTVIGFRKWLLRVFAVNL